MSYTPSTDPQGYDASDERSQDKDYWKLRALEVESKNAELEAKLAKAEAFVKYVEEKAEALVSSYNKGERIVLNLRVCGKDFVPRAELEKAQAQNKLLVEAVDAARDLHSFLHANSGTTADWPIDLVARGDDPAKQLSEKLNRLQQALAAVKP